MAVTIPSVNMSENKSVKILKAAEEGVYGVIAVCCVSSLTFDSLRAIKLS